MLCLNCFLYLESGFGLSISVAAGVEGGGGIFYCQALSVIPNYKCCSGLKVETVESVRKVGMVEIR